MQSQGSNEDLVANYRENPAEDILEQLLQRNDRLIWSIIKRFGSYRNDNEDSYQDAVEGFLNAVSSYDPNRNTKFTSWAYECVRNYIQNNDPNYDRRERKVKRFINGNPDKTLEETYELLKKDPKNDINKEFFDSVATKREIPIDKVVRDRNGNQMYLVDTEKSLTQDQSELYYQDVFKPLSREEKGIAELLLEGNTLNEIKTKLQIPHNQLNRLIERIKLKIKPRI